MNERLNDLESGFRERFSKLEVTPPAEVWNRVEAGLKRKKRLLMYRYAAIAAMLLLFAGLAFLLRQQYPGETMMVQQHDNAGQQIVAEENTTSTAPMLEETVNVSAPESGSPLQTAIALQDHDNAMLATSMQQNPPIYPTQQNQSVNDVAADLLLAADETNDLLITAENNQQELSTESTETESLLALELLQKHLETIKASFDMEAIVPTNSNPLDLSISFNSIPTSIGSTPEVLLGTSSVRYGPDPFQSDIGYQTSYFEEIESTTLQPPLSLGMKLSYKLSKRWALETGLLFTQITTVSKTVEIDNNYNSFEQELAYIGLPVGIKYDLLQLKTFQLYLNQSVVLEKGIRATNRTLRFEENILANVERKYAPIAGMQLSSISAAGINLPLYRSFSFYGEAGVQVFYLNATQPFNIRSAKQLWPVLHGGFRFNLKK